MPCKKPIAFGILAAAFLAVFLVSAGIGATELYVTPKKDKPPAEEREKPGYDPSRHAAKKSSAMNGYENVPDITKIPGMMLPPGTPPEEFNTAPVACSDEDFEVLKKFDKSLRDSSEASKTPISDKNDQKALDEKSKNNKKIVEYFNKPGTIENTIALYTRCYGRLYEELARNAAPPSKR